MTMRALIILGLCISNGAATSLQVAVQDTAPGKTFDVASVRVNRSGTTQSRTNRSATGVTIINQTLRPIIQLAYGIQQPARIIGAPNWTEVDRFDVDARGSIGGLDDFRAMMQALLADRFKLVAHADRRNMPVYSLVRARSDGRLGPSLTPSSRICPQANGRAASDGCGLRPGGPGELSFLGGPMAGLVTFLTMSQGRPVIDRAELAGNFDIHLSFAPDPIPGRPADLAAEARSLPRFRNNLD